MSKRRLNRLEHACMHEVHVAHCYIQCPCLRRWVETDRCIRTIRSNALSLVDEETAIVGLTGVQNPGKHRIGSIWLSDMAMSMGGSDSGTMYPSLSSINPCFLRLVQDDLELGQCQNWSICAEGMTDDQEAMQKNLAMVGKERKGKCVWSPTR
jgi:hypothetical protein